MKLSMMMIFDGGGNVWLRPWKISQLVEPTRSIYPYLGVFVDGKHAVTFVLFFIQRSVGKSKSLV